MQQSKRIRWHVWPILRFEFRPKFGLANRQSRQPPKKGRPGRSGPFNEPQLRVYVGLPTIRAPQAKTVGRAPVVCTHHLQPGLAISAGAPIAATFLRLLARFLAKADRAVIVG
jgi:hypothetical protein